MQALSVEVAAFCTTHLKFVGLDALSRKYELNAVPPVAVGSDAVDAKLMNRSLLAVVTVVSPSAPKYPEIVEPVTPLVGTSVWFGLPANQSSVAPWTPLNSAWFALVCEVLAAPLTPTVTT